MNNLLPALAALVLMYQPAVAQNEDRADVRRIALQGWQEPYAAKPVKSITDYYLLLPYDAIAIELRGVVTDSKAWRMKAVGVQDLKNGYLKASADAPMHMALFKDRVNKKDIIGLVAGCGEPPIQYCNLYFLEFDSVKKVWKESTDVFPWAELDKIAKQKGIDYYYFELPRNGTTINILAPENGEGDAVVFHQAEWSNGRFLLKAVD